MSSNKNEPLICYYYAKKRKINDECDMKVDDMKVDDMQVDDKSSVGSDKHISKKICTNKQ